MMNNEVKVKYMKVISDSLRRANRLKVIELYQILQYNEDFRKILKDIYELEGGVLSGDIFKDDDNNEFNGEDPNWEINNE